MKIILFLSVIALSGCVDDPGLVDGLARFSAGYAAGVENYQVAHPYCPVQQQPVYETGYINNVPYYRLGSNVYVGY